MTFKPLLLSAAIAATSGFAVSALAADYEIDPSHSFVNFKVQHLGYSWLTGRFNGVSGTLKYDAAAPADGAINVSVDTKTIDSNWAERDKHLRSADFLDVEKFGVATFRSTGFKGDANGGRLSGVLSLHGVEKPIELDVKKIGEGPDPWGGYRAGFHATYTLTRKDFGMEYDLGPAANTVELEIGIEGIRK
ncbi:MAG: YceI family protein [Gammaproteobacteria bacterium]